MAKIIKILRCENKQDHAKVYVQLDDGTEGVCYVGGSVEVFFHNQQIRVFVKKH